jgi:putative ubiquitin-RnfH superfamily antitoxin RatB of RatAB toxin-antitoxin module
MACISSEHIQAEVAYAEADWQILIPLRLEKGATVATAIARSGIAVKVPDVSKRKLGIFSRVVTPDAALQDGDRVEIYRALLIDPKEARRRRGVRRT